MTYKEQPFISYDAGAKWAKEKVFKDKVGGNKYQSMEGLPGHAGDLGFYLECVEKPLEHFEHTEGIMWLTV